MLRHLVRIPSGRDDSESMPTVILIHGRGADMNDLAELAAMFDTAGGARFVFPNAPKAFEPYPGMSFGWTWFEGWPPEPDSVDESRRVLLEFVDDFVARHPTSRLVLGGFSQGAMMSLDAGLRTSRELAGIICMSGGLYEHDLPDLAARRHVPVLITHGSIDDVVAVNYARRARRVLEDAGFDVEYHEYPMGHQIVVEEIAVVKAFLERVLSA